MGIVCQIGGENDSLTQKVLIPTVSKILLKGQTWMSQNSLFTLSKKRLMYIKILWWNETSMDFGALSWVDLPLSSFPLTCLSFFLPKYLLSSCCVTLDRLLYPSETYSSLANWRLAPKWLSSKESTCNAGDTGSIPGSGRSPGKGNGYPLQLLSWTKPRTEVPGRLQSMG